MAFELPQVTAITFTNSNPRSEFHGEEHVRAIDISMTMEGENTLLDLIEPGLREHHYMNRAMTAGQEVLPDVVIPLPNLRFSKLPAKVRYGGKEDRVRGYRYVIDYGLGGESNVDLTDCVLSSLWYELTEGGSVKIGFTVQYNGDELQDDALYGRLAGLATVGEGHVQLIAPPTLVLVKGKGYRSGKPDTPNSAAGDEGDLLGEEGDDSERSAEDVFAEDSREAAAG